MKIKFLIIIAFISQSFSDVIIDPFRFGVITISIWQPSDTPGTVDTPDASAYELGTKFKSDRDGKVLGIRFYKSAANTGTHTGRLWSIAGGGSQLASAVFSGESASGWQEVRFASPVSITAGTIYVASYSCPNGHYSSDGSYFLSAHDNPPLHAVAQGESNNGVFDTTIGVLPANSFAATCYWVDIVFQYP